MQILCPHCQSPIELVKFSTTEEIVCSSCGSSFRLESESTTGWGGSDVGRKLGKFELLGTVGHGAFGTVYKARDPELDRTVAIKVPRAGNVAEGQELDRFLREARSVAQFQHPAIVPVHEVGQVDGVPYLVSDFVEGVTLADQLTSRRPTAHEAAKLIGAVADALQYAHERGVIHRDVKPTNIMIAADSSPRVMDFGLARRDAGEVTMTLEGQVLGTPAYMSPEQARGEGHRVDGRSDVYSLGVILYLLLTGELPFRGNTRMLLHQVLHDEPRPPRSLNDRIPRNLETVCLKAMAKESGRRYPSAAELAADLRRWLNGEPVRARPVGQLERALVWARRRPAAAALLIVGALALLALAAAGLGGWYSYQMQGYSMRLEAALDETEKARGEAVEARAQTEAALARVAASDYSLRILLADREWHAGNPGRSEQLLQDCPPGLRCWEWHYLQRLCRAGVIRLEGHQGPFRSAALNADGRRLATLDDQGKVKVWETATGREVSTPAGDTSSVSRVVLSPDGRMLFAVMAGDRPAIVWDAATGREVCILKGLQRPITSAAFSPDGTRLTTAGGVSNRWPAPPSEACAWEMPSGRQLFRREIPPYPIPALAYSPDGGRLALVQLSPGGKGLTPGQWEQVPWKSSINLLDASTGADVVTLRGVEQQATCLAFSPDGKRLAAGIGDQTVQEWDVATGQVVFTRPGLASFGCLAYSADGRRLAGGAGHFVTVWDFKTRRDHTIGGHGGHVVAVAFTAAGSITSVSRNGTVRLHDAATGQGPRCLPGPGLDHPGVGGDVHNLAFSPDGRRLVAAAGSTDVTVLDLASGSVALTLRGNAGPVLAAAFSPDGRWIATGTAEREKPGVVALWDTAAGQVTHLLRGHGGPVVALAFSPDGRRLASAGEDGTIRLWDTAGGRELRTLRGHASLVEALAFSPDGTRLASGGWDQTVKLWDTDSGERVRTLAGHRNGVRSVAFSPDSRRLASADSSVFHYVDVSRIGDMRSSGEVKVWDAATGRELLLLPGPEMGYSGVAFSPDGRRLFTASYDESVRVWDAQTGQELLALQGAYRGGVAVSPDGTRLASGTMEGTVKVWDAVPPQEKPGPAAPEQ